MTGDSTVRSASDLARSVNDEIIRAAQAVTDLSEWAVPEFFESDEELLEFQRWVRTQREGNLG